MRTSLLSLIILSLFFACSGTTDPTSNDIVEDSSSYVILVSIDGFRYDYAEKFNAKNILAMKEAGTSSKAMIPSFPSKTFPNHYSIVTGMYPGTHGIVSNSFYSKSRDEEYSIGQPSVVDGSWYGGTPLWVLAEQNNMKAASYFWVGSEADIQGVKPTYYFNYDGKVPNADRVTQVIDWLKMPKEERPQFITLYFSEVDDMGHRFGPDGDETKEAVLSIDENIGTLRKGIAESGLNVTLIVTSDHGMTSINDGLSLDVDWRGGKAVFSSTNAFIFNDDPQAIEAIKSDLSEISGISYYAKGEFPEHYHFDNDDRSGDLLINIAPPRVFSRRESITGGTHGFDPYAHTDMHTIFYVEGPQIKSNYEIESFENVHIYPLIANILELPIPSDIDGNLNVLLPIIK
ncbi:MAG: ectonucleotide pyrophosphatase/phosphodiesterase [Ekhidna sp.]